MKLFKKKKIPIKEIPPIEIIKIEDLPEAMPSDCILEGRRFFSVNGKPHYTVEYFLYRRHPNNLCDFLLLTGEAKGTLYKNVNILELKKTSSWGFSINLGAGCSLENISIHQSSLSNQICRVNSELGDTRIITMSELTNQYNKINAIVFEKIKNEQLTEAVWDEIDKQL